MLYIRGSPSSCVIRRNPVGGGRVEGSLCTSTPTYTHPFVCGWNLIFFYNPHYFKKILRSTKKDTAIWSLATVNKLWFINFFLSLLSTSCFQVSVTINIPNKCKQKVGNNYNIKLGGGVSEWVLCMCVTLLEIVHSCINWRRLSNSIQMSIV